MLLGHVEVCSRCASSHSRLDPSERLERERLMSCVHESVREIQERVRKNGERFKDGISNAKRSDRW